MRRVLLGLATLVSGCGDDDCCAVKDAAIDSGPNPNLLEVALLPNTTVRDLDILFVIDDSPSMTFKQTSLKASFSSFITTLSAGGIPNIHIGVVTSDMGVLGEDDTTPGGQVGPMCSGAGKDGVLQTFNATMIDAGAKFLSDIAGVKNYMGSLTDRFNEIASAGALGCGFEQSLHAMKRALDPANTMNAGFLRPTARLGVIVLSDEDDCSAAHSTVFTTDPTTLGPVGSFRCTRYGVLCDVGGTTPDEMNQASVKDGCHSNETGTYMTDVGRYATLLKGLKADPREVVFGAIVGNSAPFEVQDLPPAGGGTPQPTLVHSCEDFGPSNDQDADPGVRIAQLAAAMPQGVIASVCTDDLSKPMTDLALRMKPLVGDNCLQQAIQQPAVCQAFDVDGSGGMTSVPACDAANTPPCFSLTEDATLCPVGTQHLKVTLVRDTAPDASVWTSVRCAL